MNSQQKPQANSQYESGDKIYTTLGSRPSRLVWHGMRPHPHRHRRAQHLRKSTMPSSKLWPARPMLRITPILGLNR